MGHLKKNIPANCALGKKKKKAYSSEGNLKVNETQQGWMAFILMDNVCCASPS